MLKRIIYPMRVYVNINSIEISKLLTVRNTGNVIGSAITLAELLNANGIQAVPAAAERIGNETVYVMFKKDDLNLLTQ